jgi:heme A synthase
MYVIGNTSTLLIAAGCIVFVVLLLTVFFRNQMGDQRMIRTTDQMLLPILSIIVIILGFVFGNSAAVSANCPAIFDTLRNITGILALLIVALGFIRYILSRPPRDRRLITQPLLIAMILLVLLVLVQNLLGCA